MLKFKLMSSHFRFILERYSENLRGSLGGKWVLKLLLSSASLRSSPGRDIAHHLLVVAQLVPFGQFLKFVLLLGTHRLKAGDK